jgi:NitT/TauT family transport system permease protein
MTFTKLFRAVWPPLLVAIGLCACLEVMSRAGLVRAFLVPPPSAIFAALWNNWDEYSAKLLQTTLASLAGFAIGAAAGISIAVLLSSTRWMQRAFYPYAVLLQTVPLIAIAPLLIVWCGNSVQAVIVCSVIVCVFPIIANTLAGLVSTDPALVDLFKLYRAGPIAGLWKLRLPFALPNILTGLRIGAGLAVIGVIVGEFQITGGGLGGQIVVERQALNVDCVYALLVLSALLGIALFGIINALSAWSLRHWHASEKEL